MNRFRSFAAGMTACLMLSGCQSVYLHDEGLQTSTGKAHEALAGVTPLKPFDDQLANLEQFAQREDLAVADYWTAVRDAHFDALLTEGDSGLQGQMKIYVADRLQILMPDDPNQSAAANQEQREAVAELLNRRDTAIGRKASEDRMTAAARRRYLDSKAKPAAPDEGADQDEEDLSCATLAKTPEEEIERLSHGSEAQINLASLIGHCSEAAAAAARIADVTSPLKKAKGLLGEVAAALAAAEAETKEGPSPRAEELKPVIEAAQRFEDEESGQARLTEFRATLRKLLAKGGAATELAGWEEAGKAVKALLRTEICDAPKDSVDEETKAGAKCDGRVPDSTEGRAKAAWAVVSALAQLQGAGARERRSVDWLLAAKAIIAAEQADAALRVGERKAKAAALRQRLDALIGETAGLVRAQLWLNQRSAARAGAPRRYANCWAALKARPRLANFNCAFAAYVDAWNQGRLPAEVLAFRPVQIDREFAVRRARSAAEKQYALALAGAATLKQYGEGGIMPESIAQLVLDLTTIGAIRVEN
jgi:hypothetical protein